MSDLENMNGSGGNAAANGLANGHGDSNAVPPPAQAVESTEAAAAAAGSNGHGGNGGDAATTGDTGAAGTSNLKAVESAVSCSSMAGDDAGTDAGASSIPPSEAGGRPPLDTACSDGGGPSSLVGGMVGPPSPLTGCYLLIILGEPHSEEHKDNILQHLLKGFLSWDVADCHVDLEEELNTITQHAPEGEEARHGERLIQYASENLVTEVLIHPQYNTLIQCMRNMLSSFTRHRHIIHAGYTFSGNGSWILQDGTFSVGDFSEAFQEHDVQRVIRAYADTISMNIHCADSGLWHTLPDKSFARLCKIRINPVDVLDTSSESINAFIDYLAPMLVPTSIRELLETSDVVGNIRFTHPTLYVFPGGQGDAALFGINGFNMLVDGGFNRKACFWDFFCSGTQT
ncbi:hypothetical protein DOY81_003597 [Sarcophaga bullata]|nr:hypothetical protein DOY81_003597 [Sarcophaga bullata]